MDTGSGDDIGARTRSRRARGDGGTPTEPGSASYMMDMAFMVVNGPKSISDAMRSSEKEKWMDAINTELQCLEDHETWEVIQPGGLPAEARPITSRVVLQDKIGQNRTVERYKARLVAHGFRQRPGIDFDDTYSPTLSFPAVRMALSKAAAEDKEIIHLDVVTAFLESKVQEDLYLQLPKELVVGKDGKVGLNRHRQVSSPAVVKLKRSLYGLRQSGQKWYHTFDRYIVYNMGMSRSQFEAGIYISPSGAILVIWVDDILLIGTKKEVHWMKKQLEERFTIKDLGPVHYFLSMLIERDRQERRVYISQETYLNHILERFDMGECKGCDTPVVAGVKLQKEDRKELEVDKQLYQEAIGSLTYASITTRPDIAYATGVAGRFSDKPTTPHWEAVKRIFRYLQGTKHLRLALGSLEKEQSLGIRVFADTDFAGEVDTLKSTTGIAILDRFGSLVYWKSKRQTTVAKSNTDAEFTATAMAVEEGIWILNLDSEIFPHAASKPRSPLKVYNDNQASIANLANGRYRPSTRHVGVRYFWLRELVENGEVGVDYLNTGDMVADGFTKGLERVKHEKCLSMLSMISLAG